MHLTIERDKALSAVQRAQAAAQRGGTIPILGNLMLAADRGFLTVVGSDLDLEAAGQAPARVEQSGSITVPAQELFEIMRAVPPGAEVVLELTSAPQRLSVRAGRSRFHLPTLPSSDFPVFATEAGAKARLEATVLRRLIDRTQFAMAGEKDARDYFKSLCLEVKAVEGRGSLLRATATDGARLAMAWTPCPAGLEGAAPVMLSRKTVGEVRGLCEEDGDTVVELTFGERLIEVQRGLERVTSKLIDGTYPNVERVLPSGPCAPVRVDAKLLAQALRRCAIVAGSVDAKGRGRAIKFALEPSLLTLSARNSEGGQAEEPVEVAYDGPAHTMSFSANAWLDALALMAGAVELEIRGKDSPTKLLDPADPAALFIVMPLRV